MAKAIRTALICWGLITSAVVAETVWILARNGLPGFQAYLQEAPFTNVPITLASAAAAWLMAGLALWGIAFGRFGKSDLLGWVGLLAVGFSYVNNLRERVRYGDIQYYTEAAFALSSGRPLPDTYLYPPLWGTLLSFLTPLGEDGILLVCWSANLVSLLLFYILLSRTLEQYGFNPQAAVGTTVLFMLVNMPILRTLFYVQVNLHVMNLAFLSILLIHRHPPLSALALAVAVHLKASPALLVIAFLMDFNWKWLAWFVAGLAAVAGITLVAYGGGPFMDFLDRAVLLDAPRVLSLRDNSFDSFLGVSFAYLQADPRLARILTYLAKAGVLLITLILALRPAGVIPGAVRGVQARDAVVPLFLGMTLVSPLVWEHHGVFMTLPFLVYLKRVHTPAEWILYGAAYLACFLIPTFDYFPWAYLRLAGMTILLGLWWTARRRADNSILPALNRWAAGAFKRDGRPEGFARP